MTWTFYEICSLVSGILLLIVALAHPSAGVSERFWGVLGGVFFVGYAFYVASQESGVYYFPIVIFIIPVGAVIFGIWALIDRARTSSQPRDPAPPYVPPVSRRETEPVARPTATARTCTRCNTQCPPGAAHCRVCGAQLAGKIIVDLD